MNHLLRILERLGCGTLQFAEQGRAAGIDHIRVGSVFHTAAALRGAMQCSGISMDFQAESQMLDTEIHPLCY